MLGNKEKNELCLQCILQTYLPVEVNFKITVTSKPICISKKPANTEDYWMIIVIHRASKIQNREK